MDTRYLFHRILALFLSLFLSYLPIFFNTAQIDMIKILSNGEIIFSLIALLTICMFELIETKFDNITIVLICFVVWLILIFTGMTVYIFQKRTPNVSYWKTNRNCLIASIIMYLSFYATIAKERKRVK